MKKALLVIVVMFLLIVSVVAFAEETVEAQSDYEIGNFILHFPNPMYQLKEKLFFGIPRPYLDEGRISLGIQNYEYTDAVYYDSCYKLAMKYNEGDKYLVGIQVDMVKGSPLFTYYYKYTDQNFVYSMSLVYSNGQLLLLDYVDASCDLNETKSVVKDIVSRIEYKDPYKPLSEPILFRGIAWGSSLSDVKDILKEYDVSAMSGHGMRTWTVEDYTEGDFAGKYYTSNGINIQAHGNFSKKVDVAGYEASFEMSFVYLPINGSLTYEESDSELFAARYTIEPADVSAAEKDLINKLSTLYGKGKTGESKKEIFSGKTTKTIWDVGGETKIVLAATDYEDQKDVITISYVWTRGNALLDLAFDAEQNSAKEKEKQQYNNSNTNGL